MPRPPPPAEALTSNGQPIAFSSASSGSASPTVREGSVGTPASRMSSFAPIFEPIASIAEAGGPTHASPAAVTSSAKAADSDRNP